MHLFTKAVILWQGENIYFVSHSFSWLFLRGKKHIQATLFCYILLSYDCINKHNSPSRQRPPRSFSVHSIYNCVSEAYICVYIPKYCLKSFSCHVMTACHVAYHPSVWFWVVVVGGGGVNDCLPHRISRSMSWVQCAIRSTLKWVLGSTSWESKGSRRNTNHITYRVLIDL